MPDSFNSAQRALVEDLIARRHELGLHERDVAKRMQVPTWMVGRIERCEGEARLAVLGKYAAAVGARIGLRDADAPNSEVMRQ